MAISAGQSAVMTVVISADNQAGVRVAQSRFQAITARELHHGLPRAPDEQHGARSALIVVPTHAAFITSIQNDVVAEARQKQPLYTATNYRR
jgi:hypothetical protein